MLEYRFSMEDDEDDYEQESSIHVDDDIGDYDEDEDEETIVVTETVITPLMPPVSMPVLSVPAPEAIPAKKPATRAAWWRAPSAGLERRPSRRLGSAR